ncbi:MAG TPA: hypothetical protein VGM21_17985 [Actinomycetota bacterium]
MKVWIKRAVGAAALAGGLLALGGAAQAHAAESARSASIDVGACGVVGLGGSQADACASAPDAVDVKVHVRHALRAGVQRPRSLAARHARSATDRLRATAPSARAEAQLGDHATRVDANAVATKGDTDTARARLAVRRSRTGAGTTASHDTTATAAVVVVAASLGAVDGTDTSPAAAADLTVGANGDSRGSQFGANAGLGSAASPGIRTGDHGTTAGGADDLSGNLGIGGTRPSGSATADGGASARLNASVKAYRPVATAAGHADASLDARTAEHATTTSADVAVNAAPGGTSTILASAAGPTSARASSHGTAANATADVDAALGGDGIGATSGGVNGRLDTATSDDGGTTTTASVDANQAGATGDGSAAATGGDVAAGLGSGAVGLGGGAVGDGSTSTGAGANLVSGAAASGANLVSGAGTGSGLRAALRRAATRPGEVAGSGGVLDGPVTGAPMDAVPSGLGDPLSLGNRQVSGADPGQAVARGLRAVGSPVDRPILGSRSPLALGSPAVPGAVVPAAPGPVGAPRLAAARSLAGITVGAGVAASGQVPSVAIRALNAKPATVLPMTGGGAVPLLCLGLAVLLVGVVTLAGARSMAR